MRLRGDAAPRLPLLLFSLPPPQPQGGPRSAVPPPRSLAAAGHTPEEEPRQHREGARKGGVGKGERRFLLPGGRCGEVARSGLHSGVWDAPPLPGEGGEGREGEPRPGTDAAAGRYLVGQGVSGAVTGEAALTPFIQTPQRHAGPAVAQAAQPPAEDTCGLDRAFLCRAVPCREGGCGV